MFFLIIPSGRLLKLRRFILGANPQQTIEKEGSLTIMHEQDLTV